VLREPRRLLMALVVFGLLVGAMSLPMICNGLDDHSGLVRYGREWEMNDALFMLLLWGVEGVAHLLPYDVGATSLDFITRLLVAVIAIAWIARLALRPVAGGADLCRRCLFAIAIVFLLSPTQFPWYFLWLIPFLTIRPKKSLLLLTALLPLYYLRFYIAALYETVVFDNFIVWIEYAPVWCLLIYEWLAGRRRKPPVVEEVVA
jgi:hypothetical protein